MNINIVGIPLQASLPSAQALNPATVRATAALTHDQRASAWRAHLPSDYWGGTTEAHPLWWVHESGQRVAVPLQGTHPMIRACVVLSTAQVFGTEDVTVPLGDFREILTDPGEEPEIISEIDPTFRRWTAETRNTKPGFSVFLGVAEGGNAFTQAQAAEFDVADSGLTLMYSPRGVLGYRSGDAPPAYIGDSFRTWLPATCTTERVLIWRSVDSDPIITPMMGRDRRTLTAEQPGT